MKRFLYPEAGYVEHAQWQPNTWVLVECPTDLDLHYLTDEWHVPESFLGGIADPDEHPRIEAL